MKTKIEDRHLRFKRERFGERMQVDDEYANHDSPTRFTPSLVDVQLIFRSGRKRAD